MLRLPFVYRATILPTPRDSRPTFARLRGYADVPVPEIALGDMRPAIEMRGDGDDRITLHLWDGRLMRQARTLDGEPMTPARFEREMSLRYAGRGATTRAAPVDFDMRMFPHGDAHVERSRAMSQPDHPMARHPLAVETSLRGWRKPYVMSSTETNERERVRSRYARAFAVVDGEVYVECPEPALRAKGWQSPAQLELDPTPSHRDAPHAFRLDDRPTAVAWSSKCGAHAVADDADVVLLNGYRPSREPIMDLASSAVFPLLHVWTERHVQDRTAALLGTLEDGRGSLDPADARLLLDTVVDVVDLQDQHALEAIAIPWQWESPARLNQFPDGLPPSPVPAEVIRSAAAALPKGSLWRDRRFLTQAAGMALGLFAQIGLLAHLFSLLVPAIGPQNAGLAMGGATVAAIVGRTLVGLVMPASADRRLVACASYTVQIGGSLTFLIAGEAHVTLMILGVILFGAGIGNATSLPPLIAQVEFAKADVARAVPLIVAVGQASYSFAPAAFGALRTMSPSGTSGLDGTLLFAAASVVQGAAIACFLLGRQTR